VPREKGGSEGDRRWLSGWFLRLSRYFVARAESRVSRAVGTRAVCAPAQPLIAISAKRGRAVRSGPSGPSAASRAAALLTARPRAATPAGRAAGLASPGFFARGARRFARRCAGCASRRAVGRIIERGAGEQRHERRLVDLVETTFTYDHPRRARKGRTDQRRSEAGRARTHVALPAQQRRARRRPPSRVAPTRRQEQVARAVPPGR